MTPIKEEKKHPLKVLNRSHLIASMLLVFWICTKPSFAQTALLSSYPTDGAVKVDTAATMSLTLLQPVDTSANFITQDADYFQGLIFDPQGKTDKPDSIDFSNRNFFYKV